MHREDTIAAIATPLGRSGIGIIRLSGIDAIKIADNLFHSPKEKKIMSALSHRIIYGHIVNPANKEIIDEVLISLMKAPNSYTKEDTVEINCHGGNVPLRRVLELVLKGGARLAEPGEFTRRAFLNGRIDLAQAEAVLDVVNALTVQSQKTALQQLRGTLSKKIAAIKEEIVELFALVEACIDFPEEETGSLSLEEMEKRAAAIIESLQKLVHGAKYGIILREGLKTAIIGRPNVGKSSLLNALLEHDRAIVTEIPGTTRDVIEEYLNIQGLPVKIMDTAGIRDGGDIAEKEGVKRSFCLMEDADLVLLILDGSDDLHATDRQLMKKSEGNNTLVVINKIDLPQKLNADMARGAGLKLAPAIRISAKKETGLDTLKNKIVETAIGGDAGHGTDMVTNIRHVRALERALEALLSFRSGISLKTAPEFLALDLRDSLDAIGEILGITTPADILERIFSNFCIGK